MRTRWLTCLMLMITIGAAPPSLAQDDDAEPLPSLDELLGLDDAKDSATDDTSDGVEEALESELEEAGQITDAFVEALGLMDQSASRLADGGDTGVVTQRIQEDILKKLEKLINDAQQNSGSPSSSSGAQQQQQQQQQPNQGQQQQQQQSDQRSEGEPSDSADAPAGQDARPGQATLNTAAWGELPERLRDALLQGSAESYSSLYRSLTESYYRRLAEEASE